MTGDSARILADLDAKDLCIQCGVELAMPGGRLCLRCIREAPNDEEGI